MKVQLIVLKWFFRALARVSLTFTTLSAASESISILKYSSKRSFD
jgi:hypothetical protein